MSMLLLRRIGNRHILWTALLMVAIGLIVPGGFGVKPPQWFNDRPPQDIASMSSVEPYMANTSTSAVTPEAAPKAEDDLADDQTIQQAPELAQTNLGRKNPVTVPLEFARHIPAEHFELSGDTQKQSFIKLILC